jgi:phage terminase small subunit
MAGRRPVPTHLKVLRGNPGKRPLNAQEPQPDNTIPHCPQWLDATARKAWRRIIRAMRHTGVITSVDRDALAIYCALYSQIEEAFRQGRLPPISLLTELRQHMTEFGFTPSSRVRLKVAPSRPENPFEEYMNADRNPC